MLRFSVLAFVLLVAPSLSAQEKRPNILFIFTDDQRADTIAALGNSHIKTPNIDQLVARGTAFTRAYCMGSRQPAVCVPSRAMMLTGRSLFRVNEKLTNQTSWPEMFARAGYATFATGKWHNGPASLAQCFEKASNIFLGGMIPSPFTIPLVSMKDDRKTFTKEFEEKHASERYTDHAVAYLKNRDRTKPFLAYVSYNLPHDPRLAPKKYHEPYAKNPPPLPPNYLPVHPFNNGEMTIRDEQLAPWPRTPEVIRKELADYYACITFIDDQVGRLIAALKESGDYENTIIVLAGDHGLAIGSHGLLGKQNLYDHSMRTPMIFAGPGIPANQKSDSFAYLFDIYPTLGGLAKVDAPDGSEGVNLFDAKTGRESLFTAYRDLQRSVHDDRWHLIVYPPIHRIQLFDLKNDPHETKDLSALPEHAGEVERLTKLLVAWQQKSNDTLPLKAAKRVSDEFQIPKADGKKKANPKKDGKKTAATPNGDAVISAKVGPSDLVITTTNRVAGAIHSLTWNGKEFIDSFDHGRQLQSACSFGIASGGRYNAEVYNPTEAGSRRDHVGPKSTSKLLEIDARDNVLTTKTQMAFWLAPGEKSNGDLARNVTTLSDHVLTKTVRIGSNGLRHAVEYEATFTVPPTEKAVFAQFEAVTGYMPPEFKDFWTLDLKTGRLEQIDYGPGEQDRPLIFSTADGLHAMGVFSPDQPSKGYEKAGYGRWRFKSERVVKWNVVFRVRGVVAPGDYTFRNFVAVGTREDVRQTLVKLAGMFPRGGG